MRLLLSIVVLILASVPVFAFSDDDLISYYNLIARERTVSNSTSGHEYVIFKESGKYFVKSTDSRVGDIEIIVDSKNGYFCIWDTHQSASEWGYKIEMAIFTSKSKNIYIAYNCTDYEYVFISTLVFF
jgi:hypothetical protein